MDNKMFCKPAYKCGVCGKEHSDISSRASCELACLKAKKEEEKKVAEAKKKAEKDTRYNEVTKAIDNAYDLLSKFVADYGTYNYNGNINNLNLDMIKNIKVNGNSYDDLMPVKLLSYFLF